MSVIKKCMMWCALAAALTLTVGACASTGQWSHPSKSPEGFSADHMACERSATRDAYGTPVLNSKAYEQCMSQRGWTRQ